MTGSRCGALSRDHRYARCRRASRQVGPRRSQSCLQHCRARAQGGWGCGDPASYLPQGLRRRCPRRCARSPNPCPGLGESRCAVSRQRRFAGCRKAVFAGAPLGHVCYSIGCARSNGVRRMTIMDSVCASLPPRVDVVRPSCGALVVVGQISPHRVVPMIRARDSVTLSASSVVAACSWSSAGRYAAKRARCHPARPWGGAWRGADGGHDVRRIDERARAMAAGSEPDRGSEPRARSGSRRPGSALVRRGRQQAELARWPHRVCAAVHAKPGVHVSQVGPDRVQRHEQLGRDFPAPGGGSAGNAARAARCRRGVPGAAQRPRARAAGVLPDGRCRISAISEA